jgi:ubiquinone/menaquinone biosynthesis C-methylase UbiE
MRGVEQIPWMYDTVLQAMEWTGLGRWRHWLAAGARGRTLDLGCGTGRNLPLLPPGSRVVGADPCPQNLARARRRAPGALLVRARAEALPFKEDAFDTVVSGFVFCSVSDPAASLAEIRRVLAPGGVLRMLEHVRSASAAWARLQDWIQPAWTAVTGGCHPNRETEIAVERAGFAIEGDGRRASESMRRFQARPLDLP